MTPEVFHPQELADADAAAWRALQRATPAFGSPLLGPDFARIVGEGRSDARVAVWRDRRGLPDAILAYHLRPGGFARPIGAPLSDYQGLVAAASSPLLGRQALADAGLNAYRASALLDPFAAFAPAPLARQQAHRIVLRTTPQDYLAELAERSANRLKNVRRYRRKLAEDIGPLSLAAPDASQDAFERLVAWKRAQLARTGLHDFLREPRTLALLQRLFEARDAGFGGLMINLYAGGRLVAGQFGVRQGDWFHPWIAARDPALDAYSAGSVHQWSAVEAMGGLGLRVYDLGPGADDWKRLFASEAVAVGAGLVAGEGLGGRLARASDDLWRLGGAGRGETVSRLARRLDQIAAMEPTAQGRLHGVFDAAMSMSRRSAARRDAPAFAPARSR